MKITVTLDEADWKELLRAAGQGYGDGTLYDLDKPNKFRPSDWRKSVNRYFRAVNGINRQIATASVAARLKKHATAIRNLT